MLKSVDSHFNIDVEELSSTLVCERVCVSPLEVCALMHHLHIAWSQSLLLIIIHVQNEQCKCLYEWIWVQVDVKGAQTLY